MSKNVTTNLAEIPEGPFRDRLDYDRARNESVDAVGAAARAEPSEAELADRARLGAVAEARRRLIATDWVAIKAVETGRPLTDEWKSWRNDLRAIAGGEVAATELPLQPEPYAKS